MVISGDDVCCSVVPGTPAGVPVSAAMWSELPMTSATSCPPWSSVHECQRVECAFTSPVRTECGMPVIYCMQCCMSVSAVWQCVDVLSWYRNIHFCNCDMLSVANVHPDHLKLCAMCTNG